MTKPSDAASDNPPSVASLLAALAHARQGAAYYDKQVLLLTKAVNHARQAERKAGPPAARAALPPTGLAFWTALVGKRPRTTSQILDAAARRLALVDPSRQTMDILRNRWSVSLLKLLARRRIVSEGQGRERRFYIAPKQ